MSYGLWLVVIRAAGADVCCTPLFVAGEATLFECGRDGRERSFKVGAKTRNHRNDRDCNSGRDQPVFNRGSGSLVFQKSAENAHEKHSKCHTRVERLSEDESFIVPGLIRWHEWNFSIKSSRRTGIGWRSSWLGAPTLAPIPGVPCALPADPTERPSSKGSHAHECREFLWRMRGIPARFCGSILM